MAFRLQSSRVLRHFRFQKGSQLGYSLIEVVIASALVGAAVLMMSSGVVNYAKATRKQKIVAGALDIQNAFREAIANPNNYGEAASRQALSAGNIPGGFNLNLNLASGVRNIAFPTPDPGAPVTVFFKGDLTVCVGGFGTPDCIYQLEANVRRINAAAPWQYGFSYRITIDPALQIPMASFGAPGAAGAAFAAADFKTQIPQYLLLSNQVANQQCAPGVTAGLRGYDLVTGQALCLAQPTAAETCANGTIPKGLKVVGGMLMIDCVAPKTWTCPADYSLVQFTPASVDPAYVGAQNNLCVHTPKRVDTKPGMWAGNLVGVTCPPSHAKVGVCTGPFVIAALTNNGTCQTWQNVWGCPLGVFDIYGVCVAPGWVPTLLPFSFPPAPGFLVNNPSGPQNIDCHIQKVPQACDPACVGPCVLPTWDAEARWIPQCTLTLPETVPASSP